MIIFKIQKIFMDMILKGLKLIELRKLDEKIIILINNFLAEKKSQKVIFEVIETGKKYQVEIIDFEVLQIERVPGIGNIKWNKKVSEIDWEWISQSEHWLNEYYKNESHIVIYNIGKVVKI